MSAFRAINIVSILFRKLAVSQGGENKVRRMNVPLDRSVHPYKRVDYQEALRVQYNVSQYSPVNKFRPFSTCLTRMGWSHDESSANVAFAEIASEKLSQTLILIITDSPFINRLPIDAWSICLMERRRLNQGTTMG